MKKGTLVAQKDIEILPESVERFSSHVKSLIAKHFPEWNGEIKTATDEGHRFHIAFIGLFTNGVTYRTQTRGDDWFVRKGDLIHPYGNLEFVLTRSLCYDESKTGPCYTWKEGYRPELDCEGFDAYMFWNGRHKSKGFQHTSGLEVKNHFLYGTEIDDLDFGEGVGIIADIYHNAKAEGKIDLRKSKK